MVRDFFKDLLRYLPSQILPSLIKLFSIPIVTRLFSPSIYGDYILAVSTFAVLSYSVSWINIAIVRFYAKHLQDNKLNILYSTVLIWGTVSLLIVSPIFFLILFFVKSYISNMLFVLMIVGFIDFFISSFFWIFMEFLRAKRAAFFYSMLSMIDSLASFFIAIILVVFFKFGIIAFFLGSIISVGASLIYIFGFSREDIFKISSKSHSVELVLSMAKYSIPIVIGNLAYWILTLSDRYIIGIFRGAQEVGIYSASYSMGEKTILFFTLLFSFVATPICAVIWERDGVEKSKEFISNLMRYFLLFAIPATIGVSILSKPLILIFTSRSYYSGYIILPWVAFSMLIYGIFNGFSHGLFFYKKTYYEMWCVIVAGLLNILLNIMFVPKMGYYAAAWSTFIGYVAMLLLMIYFSRKFFKWSFPFVTLIKSGISSMIMGIVVYSIWRYFYFLNNYLNLFIDITIGIFIYFACIFIFNEINKEERKEIWKFIKKGSKNLK